MIAASDKTTVYKNSVYREAAMLRHSDIQNAFRNSLSQNPKGYLCLRTSDFIRELREKGIHFSDDDANRWIERNQSCFADKTPDHSNNRLWILRNMGRVL